ncbi:hypothetical protein BDE02_05G044800 [Populus trichocarpa]|nr:hypothetical protein BDE02_05G044800 [Populus trichocarpa]
MTMETVAVAPTPTPTPTTHQTMNNDTTTTLAQQKNNRIQVSNTKKPLFFYVNLAKRYMQQYNEVELSALGMAITTVVTIAEILKNNGLATEKKVLTSTVCMKDENKGRQVQKAKLQRRRQPKRRMMRNSEATLMFSFCSSVSTFLFSVCLIA